MPVLEHERVVPDVGADEHKADAGEAASALAGPFHVVCEERPGEGMTFIVVMMRGDQDVEIYNAVDQDDAEAVCDRLNAALASGRRGLR